MNDDFVVENTEGYRGRKAKLSHLVCVHLGKGGWLGRSRDLAYISSSPAPSVGWSHEPQRYASRCISNILDSTGSTFTVAMGPEADSGRVPRSEVESAAV